MKVAIHTPVWKRLELTRAFYIGLQRNIEEFAQLGIELIPFIAVSEQEHEDLVREFSFNYVWATNRALGCKNQELLNFMRGYEWEYLIQLGSDDFILPGGAEVITENIAMYEFAAFDSVHWFHKENRIGWTLKDCVCGAGRFMSRRVAFCVKELWNDRKKGLDTYSANQIYNALKLKPVIMQGTYIADVKTDVNVTSWQSIGPCDLKIDEVIPEARYI